VVHATQDEEEEGLCFKSILFHFQTVWGLWLWKNSNGSKYFSAAGHREL